MAPLFVFIIENDLFHRLRRLIPIAINTVFTAKTQTTQRKSKTDTLFAT